MPTPVHKVIVSNLSALTAKYGPAFNSAIQPAIQALIAADAARGINSVTAYVDDAQLMSAAGAQPVTNAADQKLNKAAVDAIFNYYKPDYLLILGAVDIIPHQDLTNPVFAPNDDSGDPDRLVPSDLPYACPGGYSSEVRNFLNPTRVVGRLPDVKNVANSTALVTALKTAAGFKSRPASVYQQYLGVTAGVWVTSTQLSLTGAFGNATDLQTVPPRTYRWKPAQLARASHFFNCHGDVASSKYFGQPASGAATYPPAQDAAYIAGKIRVGTVAAAECCYGAELYDPALAGGQHGIPNQYFMDGAYGFLGSTTIAYGPSDTNDWADVVCRDFFIELLGGASIGRAVLQARQKYIAARAQLSPIDLKTLAQFYLLGDPAVVPVTAVQPTPKVMTMKGLGFAALPDKAAGAFARAERRAMLEQNGLALASSVGVAAKGRETGPQIKKLLQSRLAKFGVKKATYRTFAVEPPPQGKALFKMALAMGGPKLPQVTHLAIGRLPRKGDLTAPRLVGIELVEYDGTVSEQPFQSR